jgi:hypothetical protein
VCSSGGFLKFDAFRHAKEVPVLCDNFEAALDEDCSQAITSRIGRKALRDGAICRGPKVKGEPDEAAPEVGDGRGRSTCC